MLRIGDCGNVREFADRGDKTCDAASLDVVRAGGIGG